MNFGNYKFTKARVEDIKQMVEIEQLFFENGIAYTEAFIENWMSYNDNMFYVIRNKKEQIKGFTILVPITKECYQLLLNNEIKDMMEFKKEYVLQTIQSEYYYFADVAVNKQDPLAALSILNEIQIFLCRNAHYVATTPITDDGERVCHFFHFGPKIEKGQNCFLEIDDKVLKECGDGFKKKKLKKN